MMYLGSEPPEPSEIEIELGIFEDNVQHGVAKIRQHIKECNEGLKGWRQDLRDRPDSDDRQAYREQRSYLYGLQRALQHLYDEMGTETAFDVEDKYIEARRNDSREINRLLAENRTLKKLIDATGDLDNE